MATRTIKSTGGDWGSTGTWVEGAVPTTADDVVATASSGNVTISAAASCGSIDLTGYTGTLTHNSGITLTVRCNSNGATLVKFPASGWTYSLGSNTAEILITAGTGNATCYLDTNGVNIGALRWTTTNYTIKLSSNLMANGLVSTVTNTTFDANGFNVTAERMTFGSSATTTLGSGTWTITGNNATVWSQTGGTVNRGNPIVLNYSGSTGTRTLIGGGSAASNVTFIITAGTDTIAGSNAGGMTFDGFAGSWSPSGSMAVWGSLVITNNSSGMSLSSSSAITLRDTATQIDSAIAIDRPITINVGTSETVTLAKNLTLGSTRALTLTQGTLDFSNKNVSAGSFSSSNSNTRTLKMGSGTLTLSRTATFTIWNTATATNLTIDPGTCSVVIADGAAASVRTLNGSPTFYNLSCQATNAQTLTFTDGTTTTVTNSLTLTGSAGQLITLQGSSTGGWTLAVPSTQSISYVSVSRSTATGNTAVATNSTDGGNNVNWTITPPAPTNSVAPSCTPSSGTTASTFVFSSGTWVGASTWSWEYRTAGSGSWTQFSTSQNPSIAGSTFGVGSWNTRLTATNAGGSTTADGTTITVTSPSSTPTDAGNPGIRTALSGLTSKLSGL